jgi:hypothetical protein
MTKKPQLALLEPYYKWQGVALRIFGFLIGLRGKPAIAFIETIETDDEQEMIEPTINDLKRMAEESAINSVGNTQQQTTN